MLLREKLVRAELAAAKLGIREVGGNNHGPWVKKFLAEVGLPEGYAWCDAFQSYEMHAAAGRWLPVESASVWQTYTKARQLGWLATRPFRGDLVLYDFNGDGRTDDHIGIVVRVLHIDPVSLILRTVEGNTGDGSAADGDGVYVRVRAVRRSSVSFVRIPGEAPKPARKPVRKVADRRKPRGPQEPDGARQDPPQGQPTLTPPKPGRQPADGARKPRGK